MEQNDKFGYRVQILRGAKFPKKIHPEDTIQKAQKAGKHNDAAKVTVALMQGSLYLKSANRYHPVRLVLHNAIAYTAREICYRLEIGIGAYTDDVRLLGDAIMELFHRKGLPIANPKMLKDIKR